MDESDTERMLFKTPSLTPFTSETSTSDYFDFECSFSQLDLQRRMSILASELPDAVNLCSQLEDNESESDVQDQQPTEATDDSDTTSQIQTTTVNIINNSLHPQPSQERNDDSVLTVKETTPLEESSSTITSDTEPMTIEERHPQQTFNYSRSLCVAYTDDQDEISTIKEQLTTTTTLEFTEIIKKDKNVPRHIMISYNESTKVICSKIAKLLKNRNYLVWIDQDNITGDIFTSMASAIENCFVVLMAINEEYYQSRYCRLEAEYSVEQNKASIPMIMQSGYKPLGWLGIINGAKLHIDFSKLPFDEAFHLLVREIEAVRISLGIDDNDQTVAMPVNNQITTTIDNSWTHTQNVQDWTSDDVIEWLNREKLLVFENALHIFTGSTLWQLYKIKLDSAPDYYRMTETLLPSSTPLRLVYILQFHAALEALFSSSTQRIHR